MSKKLKNIIPWVVAVGIFAWLFHIYPPQKIWNALQYVRLSTFIPFAIGYFFLIYYFDILAMSKMLQRFGFNVGIKDLIPARGATYLMMVLNYAAGQAGFAYFLKRKHHIPLWEVFSIFFFIAVIDLYWIITLALIGSFFQHFRLAGIELKTVIWLIAGVAYFLFILNLLFWQGPLFKKLEKKNWAFLKWIREKDIFRIFKEAKLSDYFKLAVLRIPIHISLIISMYIVLRTFGVFVPFLQVLCNIPIVILVGTLPITPGGLGTTNAAMVELLSPYLKGPIFDQGLITPSELLF
ncbi:MAG: lysylphosphatidylglycerol synthase transmembrane domain-containing protein, partial [Deltaproteobacteria bacterium]|nr:lysylphosphatidylglycerol synthase transmembrane domain-containing protein [Deltaproteobacteria bacterium]